MTVITCMLMQLVATVASDMKHSCTFCQVLIRIHSVSLDEQLKKKIIICLLIHIHKLAPSFTSSTPKKPSVIL